MATQLLASLHCFDLLLPNSAEIHSWEFHIKNVFSSYKTRAPVLALIVTCRIDLNGRFWMSLRGEQLMLFTAIRLCLSPLARGVIVHWRAESGTAISLSPNTYSPWFWTTDANGRFVTVLYRIWSLGLMFNNSGVYQNIICPGWIKLTFWKVAQEQQVSSSFVLSGTMQAENNQTNKKWIQ